jgi:hypothetical protein
LGRRGELARVESVHVQCRNERRDLRSRPSQADDWAVWQSLVNRDEQAADQDNAHNYPGEYFGNSQVWWTLDATEKTKLTIERAEKRR